MIAGLDVHGEVKQMGAHTCLLPGRSDVKAKNPQLTDIPQIASLQKWENGSHKDPPRSARDAARLFARYHLPSSLDGAECHHAPQKRLTRRRQ